MFKAANKFTYTFAAVEEAAVEYTLTSPIKIENGVELTMPLKGDFTHNTLQFKYVNEDASDSVVVDALTLNSLNWNFYNVKVADIPADGKQWYLTAMLVEKTGHPANKFDGEFYLENIYFGSYNKVATEQVEIEVLSVWPTVATDIINVEAPASAMVEVYSVDGRMLVSLPAVGDSDGITLRTLNVNNFVVGVYLVNIATTEGVQTIKFVKE